MGSKAVSEAARQVARIIAGEAKAESIVERCSQALAETFDLEAVHSFFGAAPESGANVFFFDRATKTGGFRIDSPAPLGPDAIAGIAALTEVIGATLEAGAKANVECRFRRHLEPLSDAMVVWDYTAGALVFANEAMAKLSGYATTELAARTEPLWTLDASQRRDRAARAAAFERGERARYVDELALRRKDGSVARTEVRSYFARDELTGHLLVCSAARALPDEAAPDVARHEKTPIEPPVTGWLADPRAQMQSLLDHLPDIVSLRDLDNRVLACNARLEQLKGVGPGALIGEVLEGAMRFENGPPSRPIRGERWLTFESDGHRELVETLTAPIRDAQGKTVAILGVGRDITASRAAEEQLRAVQKMEAIGRLAGSVAHDFNNLLSVILSYTNLAIETLPPDHELQADFSEILAAGKRGEGLTKQLLAFSRRQLLHMAPLVLGDVVDDLGRTLERVVGEHIELRIRRNDGGARTKADRAQIEQVITNVAVNAREAMPDGGRLTIATARVVLDDVRAMALDLPRGGYLELSVRDTGVGMDQATLRRVFEPFFTTKDRGKGTGLGLAMAYGFLRQSGGAIAIESVPDAGTTVRIFLPEYVAPVESPAPRRRSEPKLCGHETVLVVEDEGPLRTVARRILKAAGYDVLTAANAEEALRIAQEVGDRIDIVFTDVVMPGMNGGELAERLLALYPRLKVVFTSGYTDEKLARSGVGEHRFLPKPYEPAQLTATIRAVLDRRGLT